MNHPLAEVVEWLATVEHMAHKVYREAADAFPGDPQLTAFFAHLAEDEAWHYHVMASALHYVQAHPDIKSAVRLDDVTQTNVETPLRQAHDCLQAGSTVVEELLECVLKAEFSEWNSLFLYAIEVLQGHAYEFEYAAAKMQHHMTGIERFLSGVPGTNQRLEEFNQLPEVWNRRVLVVEDNQPLLDLYRQILSREAAVDCACNGVEGLEKVRSSYYDAVVSDVDMPEMDGATFYLRARELDPSIAQRFLFASGNPTKEVMGLCARDRLPCLLKPVRLAELTLAVLKVLEAAPTRPVPGEALVSPARGN